MVSYNLRVRLGKNYRDNIPKASVSKTKLLGGFYWLESASRIH